MLDFKKSLILLYPPLLKAHMGKLVWTDERYYPGEILVKTPLKLFLTISAQSQIRLIKSW
jgi:hypothetical protein